MERIHKEKEKLYEIAASGRLADLCECTREDEETDSYYVKRDKVTDCLVKYDFENMKELQELLNGRSELLKDGELKTLICIAAFKMKHICDDNPVEKDRAAGGQELPTFIYNM